MLVTIKCTYCSELFKKQQCYIRKNNFCCRDHYHEWRRLPEQVERQRQFAYEYRWPNHKRQKRRKKRKRTKTKKYTGSVTVHCEYCGKPVSRYQSELKKYKHHFCSKEHHGLWRTENQIKNPTQQYNPPITRLCAWCDEPVTMPYAWAKRHERSFCCEEHRRHWWSERFSGDGNPNWQGGITFAYYGSNWRSQQRKVRIRDQNACQQCGITADKISQDMDVHHIRPFHLFVDEHNGDIEAAAEKANILTNLTCYCRSCHLIIEHKTERNLHCETYVSS